MLTRFHCFRIIIVFNIFLSNSIETKMGHFSINQNQLAHTVKNEIKQFADYLFDQFGTIDEGQFYIDIIDNKLALPTYFPVWATGIALNNNIIIDNTKIKNSPHLLKVLRHEICHLYQHSINNYSTFPSWFKEGMAMFLAKQFSIDNRYLISKAVWMNCLIDLNDLDQFSKLNETEINLAYEQSLMAYEKLIKLLNQKPQSIKDIFLKMQESNATFNTAFESVVGISVESFTNDYNNTMQGIWAIIFKKSNFWFFIATILLLIIYIVIKIKNRRIIKKWEIEELNEME